MSTLKVDTLQNRLGSKSVPVDTVIDGSAKAWVNFNGVGTVAIRAAFNVSSITDVGVGGYTANFAVPMPDTNYAMVATAGNDGTNNAIAGGSNGDPTVNGHGIVIIALASGSAVDTSRIRAAFFR